MNSPFANIFLALQQHVQDTVTGIRHIDQDLGQLRTGSRPPVAWPCLLIDFEAFTFGNMATDVQTANGTITFRIGFPPFSNSGQGTPTQYVKQAIAFYDLEWDLHRALQGWSPGDDYGHLSRISAATEKRTDHYRVRELRYSLAFEDYSTKDQQIMAPTALDLECEIGNMAI